MMTLEKFAKNPHGEFMVFEINNKQENHELWDEIVMKGLVEARMLESFWFEQWRYKCGMFTCTKCSQKANWLRQIHEQREFVCMSCWEKWVDQKDAELLCFVKTKFDETNLDVKKLIEMIQRR